jgi:hypothetical protein
MAVAPRTNIDAFVDYANGKRLEFREWAKTSLVTRAAVLGTCNLVANRVADYALDVFSRPLGWVKTGASYIPGVNFFVNKLNFIELTVKGNFMERGRKFGETIVGEDPYLALHEGDPERQDAIRGNRVVGDILGMIAFSFLFSAPVAAIAFPYAQVFLQYAVDRLGQEAAEEPIS